MNDLVLKIRSLGQRFFDKYDYEASELTVTPYENSLLQLHPGYILNSECEPYFMGMKVKIVTDSKLTLSHNEHKINEDELY